MPILSLCCNGEISATVFELCRASPPHSPNSPNWFIGVTGPSQSMRVRRLAMLLSGLEPHLSNSVELEQYSTDGDLAARWLTDIAAFGDLSEGCTVADLGAGNGVLGLGALAMGAGRAILVEADEAACDVANSNAESMGFADSVEVIQATLGSDPVDLSSADVVISNPPWGRQTPRADRPFLEAMIVAATPAHCYTVLRPLTSNLCLRMWVGRPRDTAKLTSRYPQRIRTTVGREEELELHSGASPLPEPTAHSGRTVHRGLAGRRADDRCSRRLRLTRILGGNPRRNRSR